MATILYRSSINTNPTIGVFGAMCGMIYGMNFHEGLFGSRHFNSRLINVAYYGSRVGVVLGFAGVGFFKGHIILPYVFARKAWNCMSPYHDGSLMGLDFFIHDGGRPIRHFPYLKTWI